MNVKLTFNLPPEPGPPVPRPRLGAAQVFLFCIFPLLLLVPLTVRILSPFFEGLTKGPSSDAPSRDEHGRFN